MVRTNALADLEVRPGLERYGGDCYFDAATWRVVKIVRRERGRDVTYTPASERWTYIKFCFRSSLFSLVTLVDHLYGVHLLAANVVVAAARECLSAKHPARSGAVWGAAARVEERAVSERGAASSEHAPPRCGGFSCPSRTRPSR